VPAPTLLQVMY